MPCHDGPAPSAQCPAPAPYLTMSPLGIFMFLRKVSISGGHSCMRLSMSGMRRLYDTVAGGLDLWISVMDAASERGAVGHGMGVRWGTGWG